MDLFQLTHPARGATGRGEGKGPRGSISTHAPREGCDGADIWSANYQQISTHAPREGCDGVAADVYRGERGISTHAPREGCDLAAFQLVLDDFNFNSRTPRGVRRTFNPNTNKYTVFQLTHPARGATNGKVFSHILTWISTHAPREGCDVSVWIFHSYLHLFQLTHPARGATCREKIRDADCLISTHAPREGCDR